MAEHTRAAGDFWEHVRELRRAVLFDTDGSRPDAVVTEACRGEAEATAGTRPVDQVAHGLECQAHERGLLQRCPPLRWPE